MHGFPRLKLELLHFIFCFCNKTSTQQWRETCNHVDNSFQPEAPSVEDNRQYQVVMSEEMQMRFYSSLNFHFLM